MPATRSYEGSLLVSRPTTRGLARFVAEEDGVTAPVIGMSLAMLLGFAGLGTEVGSWYVTKRSMQGAADAAAYSAAVAGSQGQSYSADGNAVAATFGYVNGVKSVTVQINNPPTGGAYSGLATAYEAVISQPQPQLFSKLFTSTATTIKARAVAATTGKADGCVMTLGTGNNAGVTVNGGDTITLTNCSLIDNATGNNSLTMNGNAKLSASRVMLGGGDNLNGPATLSTTEGVFTNQSAASDPYSYIHLTTPPGCDQTNFVASKKTTINPGVYCGGITVSSADLTLNAGVYYLNDGGFTTNGKSSVTGDGVTIVFTSDNGTYGTLTINGNATVTLTPPTTGSTAGFVFFENGSAPEKTATFNGGNTLNLSGIVYLPSQDLNYNGQGTSTCTQIVARTITFNGNANLGGDCSGVPGVNPLGNSKIKLVE